MTRRVRFGSTTSGTLDALDGQIDTGNENGNNPDNDLVIRDSTGTIVARYNESATTWQLEQPLDLQSNNVTNVETLDTEDLRNPPTGVIVGLDGDQTVADNTVTDVEWGTTVQNRGTVSDLLNATENVVEVPEGYEYASVSCALWFANPPEMDIWRPLINGSASTPGWGPFVRSISETDFQRGLNRTVRTTGWADVNEGDEIGVGIRIQNGDLTLEERPLTYLGVWLR